MKAIKNLLFGILSLLLVHNFIANVPQLSIIIPCYFNDPISEYLQDLSTQDFFQSSELIIVSNDIDPLAEIAINHYMQKFPNIHLIKSLHLSMSSLFNKGISQASAPFLTLFNIGDYREPRMLNLHLGILAQNPGIDLVYSDFLVAYEQNGFKDVLRKWYSVPTTDFESSQLFHNMPGTHYVWRKSVHEKYGYLKESFHYSFFWEFWNRCVFHGAQFYKVPGVAGNYFFNYFHPRKIFFTNEDLEKCYREDKYIRETFKHIWDRHYNFPEKAFVIVTASYNNKNWYKRNIDSLINQNYTNYRIIYIDDRSPDQTGHLVKEYVTLLGKENKIDIQINDQRIGALANIYNAVHSCDKHEIVLLVDGDDWLSHNNVLNHLNAIYQDPNVWLTYGQFQWFPLPIAGFAQQVPSTIIDQHLIRQYSWVTTHLRTFYAGLFHNIKKEDLIYENDQFYPMAWDLAIMIPMLEMGRHHCKFINEVMYVYNTANNINDDKVNPQLQIDLGNRIRQKKCYEPIESCI